MKLFKTLLSCLLICSALWASAQDDISKGNFALKHGISLFGEKKYNGAKKYFDKAIKYYPQGVAFYFLALTENKLGDSCNYCKNLRFAGIYGKEEAAELFDSVCVHRIKSNYNGMTSKEFTCWSELTTEVCSKETHHSICVRNLENGKVSKFNIVGFDSISTKDMDFFINFPEFIDLTSNKLIFTIAEDMPEYPGGDEARVKFICDYIKYPRDAREGGIQGTVYVTFIIEKDGKVSNVRILRGIGGGCDEEVIRIVNMMPKWKPAICMNKPVRVQFNMPCKFTLN